MQLWQQHLMYKQLQEIQRQQQLQQLDQGARQLSPRNVAKPATGNQSAVTLNETPINDAHNCMWSNNFVGGTPNLTSNSQMFSAGNTKWDQSSCSAAMHNLTNGVVISNDQSEAVRSMGFMSQHTDQTLHGIPVSVTGSVNQYSHFLGMFNHGKADTTKAEKASYPSRTFQTDQQLASQGFLQGKTLATHNFQGKHVFGNSPVQVFGSDATSGNFQQANNLQHSVMFKEFHGRQEQDDSSGNLQGKPVSQVGTSSGVASLDPIEQKLLFGTDDDNWGFSFGGSLISGMGRDMHGHSSENDYYGACPSIHSGSWSALMQEAVQASCSDKGIQDEWTGLGVKKSGQLMVKPPLTNNDNGKQPAAWDDRNLQSASSLSSTPFPLFNDVTATPSPATARSNQHPSKYSNEESNRVLTEASHASFMSSYQGANSNEFHQSRKQSQLAEGGLQSQMPSTSGVWAGQTIEQHDKSSGNILFKSQDIGGGWGNQQNLPLSNVSIQSVNRVNGWNTSYPMAFRGDNTSNYHDDNLCKTGENHVNLNSGLQPVKSYTSSPKMQGEDSLAGNFGSVRNPNNLKLNQDMHQQTINTQQTVLGRHFALNTCVNSEGDQDVEKSQNRPSKRPQTWELSVSTTVERLSDNHKNERDHGRVISGEGYVGNTAKEKALLTGNEQSLSVSGSQMPSIQSGHVVGYKMSQNSLGTLRMVKPSFPPNHPLSVQGLSNSVLHGLDNEEQKFVGKTQFAGHIVPNDPMIMSKGTAVGAEELQSRNTMPVSASNNSFDESTAQYSENETISQASNNMLELLHKVDQSQNGNSVNASDLAAQAAADISVCHPDFDQCSNFRGFGLQLAPPSERQPLSNYAPISQKSINDINSRRLDHEAGYQDQPRSNSTSLVQPVHPLDEASKRENWDKISSLSGEKHKEHPEANKHFIFSSAVASDFPLEGNQLHEQQQQLQQHISSAKEHLVQQQQQWQQLHHSGSIAHGVLDQSVNFSFSNQANISAVVKNASLIRQARDSHDGAVPGQSYQTSLPTPAGRIPTSGVASFAETQPTFAGFSQNASSGQQIPVSETKSASHSSISGMSQQVGFSKMSHNVWTNISARQSQAGINPHILTPNMLRSIINNGSDTSLWGMPKAGNQLNKEGSATPEVGTSSANSQKEENPVQIKSLSLIQTENADVAYKSVSASQGEAAVLKPPLDMDSSVPISSVVRLHQQDVNKAKNEQDPALSSPVLRFPLTSIVSSSSDIGISRCMSKPSDVQQQNYSLLHQVQSMKASDSDVNKMTGKIPEGVGSNASQMNFNIDQRFDHEQNTVFRIPADGKVGAASQISFPPDAKMLSFASIDSEERNPSTSTAGWHDLQIHMHPLGTSSPVNIMRGSERTQISPQMAPSWFEHYGTYQNGRMAAGYDAQQYFFQKVPAKMDDNDVLEQRLDSSQVGSYRHGTLAIAPNESSPSLLPPDIMDKDIITRSKKRKTTTDFPWHKMVTEPQSLPSISMAELDWAQVANTLIEKVDDEAETMEDGLLVPQSRRRLILTTQLMHQLFPAVPAVMLRGEATSIYESLIFPVAKSALADACSLVSSSKSDSHVLLGNENMIYRELNTSKKVEDDTFTKLMEDFISRSKKLETDFSRVEKRTSMLDVRLECQELERFSIVNRLGKFHGRTHADGADVSSISEAARRKIFPQRYITALSVPGNLPEGVLCLSL